VSRGSVPPGFGTSSSVSVIDGGVGCSIGLSTPEPVGGEDGGCSTVLSTSDPVTGEDGGCWVVLSTSDPISDEDGGCWVVLSTSDPITDEGGSCSEDLLLQLTQERTNMTKQMYIIVRRYCFFMFFTYSPRYIIYTFFSTAYIPEENCTSRVA